MNVMQNFTRTAQLFGRTAHASRETLAWMGHPLRNDASRHAARALAAFADATAGVGALAETLFTGDNASDVRAMLERASSAVSDAHVATLTRIADGGTTKWKSDDMRAVRSVATAASLASNYVQQASNLLYRRYS